MAYFFREDANRHRSPPRRQGKQTGGPVEIHAPKDVLTRDAIIQQNISAMQPKDDPAGKNGGVMRFIGDTEHVSKPARNVHKKPDNDIFGPPVIAPAPRPRIRAGVSDEELARIWKEDDAKVRAAAAMERAPTIVEKMVAEPLPACLPQSGRLKDAQHPPRKHVNLFTETTERRNLDHAEPAGFAGMGAQCKSQGRQGRSCKAPEEFLPPELKLKPRGSGRRTKFPPDTFSFQDDSQTA